MNKKSTPVNGRGVSLGEAAEDGLKAVYKLRGVRGPVSTSALAASLGVTEPTATAMIKRLARLGLLVHTPYHGVDLTPSGEAIALEIIRHHRLLEAYLVRSLGLNWAAVHAEAERLEHVISEEMEDRMDAALGHPVEDPHGDPIPTREGHMDALPDTTLAHLEPGERAEIRSVPDGDPELLHHLADLGLVPGVSVDVLDKAPFRGPIVVAINGKHRAIGVDLAAVIRVDGSRPVEAGGPTEEVTDDR